MRKYTDEAIVLGCTLREAVMLLRDIRRTWPELLLGYETFAMTASTAQWDVLGRQPLRAVLPDRVLNRKCLRTSEARERVLGTLAMTPGRICVTRVVSPNHEGVTVYSKTASNLTPPPPWRTLYP